MRRVTPATVRYGFELSLGAKVCGGQQGQLRTTPGSVLTGILDIGWNICARAHASPPTAPIIDSHKTICNYGSQLHRRAVCS